MARVFINNVDSYIGEQLAKVTVSVCSVHLIRGLLVLAILGTVAMLYCCIDSAQLKKIFEKYKILTS